MDRGSKLVFRTAAVVNWLVAIGGFLSPDLIASFAKITPVNYPFLVRIWTGMVIMFGAMFWEISNDFVKKRSLIKYAWIEKSVTAFSVTLGFATGNVPISLFMLILFTDYLWIPIFIHFQRKAKRLAC